MIAWLRRVLGLPARPAKSSPSVPTSPIDCPACSGDIVPAIDPPGYYVCAGIAEPERVRARLRERFPSLPPPTHVEPVPPCGWRDRADGFGTAWW